MKKMLLCWIFIGGFAVALDSDIEKALPDNIKTAFGVNAELVSINELKSIKGLHVAILKSDDGKFLPLYVSDDGKSFLPISNLYYFSNQDDKNLIDKTIDDIKRLSNQAIDERMDAIFNSIPKEAFVSIKSDIKTDDLITIVTDPDCPYCRKELENIKERLKTANVRMVFAPVHDETAYQKSAIILEETKKLKSSDVNKIIAVFQKYYQDVNLSEKQKQTDTKFVHDNAKTIFDSGIVRGVPYIHNGKLK
jgi:thiol:disulfide interchange protein DsbC